MKKVIIIGGGISGLSLAARLLHQGFKVEVYEKNHNLGGVTNSISFKDFKFDLSASLLMIPKDYTDVFYDCDRDYNDYFKMIPLNTLYKVFYSDGSNYEFKNNLPKLSNTINNITNNTSSSYGYFQFLSSNYKKYLLAEKHFLNRSFLNNISFFNPYKLHKALKLHTLTSCYHDCHKYISNKKLISFLMFQSMYIGVSPYSSPNIYNLIPAVTQFNGLFYIKGGMYSYVKALEELVYDLGGKIKTSTEVNEILFNDNKAIGIKTKYRRHYADIVVSSADYSFTLNNLIKNKSLQGYIKDKESLEYSCSTFILYLALDKKYPNLNIHNIYINKNFKSNIEAPFKGVIPNNPSLYIYCPSSIDKSLCPNDCEIINVMVRVPNLSYKNISWDKGTIKDLEKKLLKILCSIKCLEDITSHIVYKSCLTPVEFEKNFNSYYGSCFGISHNLNQSLVFRPQCTLSNIENLYFTGTSVHPGTGVSMVLKSSKICADLISKKFL